MPTFNDQDTNLTKGYTIALVSAVILSLTAIFIRYLTDTYQLPALILAFWRNLMVTGTLFIVLSIIRPRLLKMKKQHLLHLIAYGFILSIFNSLWTFSVILNGAAISTVMVYSSVVFTALLGWLLLNEKINTVKLVAIGSTLAGCVLVSGAFEITAWDTSIAGIIAGTLSGLLYAAYSLMGRSSAQRQINSWTTLLYTFGFAMLFLLIFNFVFGGLIPGTATEPSEMFWLGNAIDGWAVLFLLAAGPTLLGYGLYNVSLSYLPASVANLILTLEPVFTILLAYVLFEEALTLIQVGGSSLILGSVIILRVSEGRLLRHNQHAIQRI